ncbi:MAG TPA: histidine kinase [Candidatus Acidoferrum sp.]|jgi:signal transduction histidine kinase
MTSHESDRRHLERQILYARPIIIVLSILSILEWPATPNSHRCLIFLFAYLFYSLALVAVDLVLNGRRDWSAPLAIDLVLVVALIYISPFAVPVWFPFLFASYATGSRWGLRTAMPIAAVLALVITLVNVVQRDARGLHLVTWISIVGALFASGAGLAFLGDRSSRFASQSHFLSSVTATMQVEQGLAECLRLFLEELAQSFEAEQAFLAFRDMDLERIFLWRLKSGETERLSPDSLPLARADGLLLDDMDAALCWNSVQGAGSGFGWDRRNHRAIGNLPRLPGPTQHEFDIRNFMTVAFDQNDKPAGRLFIVNGRRPNGPFHKEDLAWLERVSLHVGPSLENVFLLRHLRARAIEAERSRISRDLHDGILQTLLSIEIQLDVLRRRVNSSPDHAEAALAGLQQTVRNESAELRHFVTDLRPVRVQSADLTDLMRGFAERYRNESSLALDLLLDSADLRAPDRVCREVFQIYREALNNIKKHAKATHVVVKLSQDDSRLLLVVDDNGEGFSFAGKFTGDELDRLRLGPISIKERTRTVNGALTVESNPGHGARLTIEIPLG